MNLQGPIPAIKKRVEFNMERVKEIIHATRKFYCVPATELQKLGKEPEIKENWTDNYSVRVANRLDYGNFTDVIICDSTLGMFVLAPQVFLLAMGMHWKAELELVKPEQG